MPGRLYSGIESIRFDFAPGHEPSGWSALLTSTLVPTDQLIHMLTAWRDAYGPGDGQAR
jgi:hypothetical protein